MNRELLAKAFGDIDEQLIAQAYRPAPEDASSSSERVIHMKKKRIISLALAAALILALGAAASAAGWIAPIFHSIRYIVPAPEERKPGSESYYSELEKKNAVMEAAEQYMIDTQLVPETARLPEFENCEITLLERFYDGENLELGVHLESDLPVSYVVYNNEEEIMEKAKTIAFSSGIENDDIEMLDPVAYDELLAYRSDKSKEYGLRHVSSIVLDSMLCHELTPEEYEAAWRRLLETGHLCVARNQLYVSDHILMEDGTDLGQTYSVPVYDDMAVRGENVFIDAPELPEAAKGLDNLTFQLNVRLVRSFYYMELDGSTRYYSEFVGEAFVPFRVENAKNG